MENDICECENCKNYPIKHFDKCSICGSESYHKVVIRGEKKKKEDEE